MPGERVIVGASSSARRATGLDRFRALLADDVTWEGPTWRAGNADECVAAFRRASGVVARVDIEHLWVDGADAVTWCTASPHPQ